MNTKTKPCGDCNRSVLSLLLLRPTPIAKAGPLVPPGAESLADAGVLASGLLPARAPTESRTVLRLLRQGFVYIYIPNAPKPLRPWLVYQINDNGDVIPQSSDAFNPASPPKACTRDGHNAAGRRLLPIPHAHELTTIWVAFSANLWNNSLRQRNAANPEVMQKVNLKSGSDHTFKPTPAELRSKVIECALHRFTMADHGDHDYPFASLADEVDALVSNMKRAASCHPQTVGKELAVVVSDPVAYATELNALRIRRYELAKDEMAKPENAYPLNSAFLAKGLERQLIDAASINSFTAVSPLRTLGKYNAEKWPAGTHWEPVTPEDRRLLLAAAGDSFVTAPYREMFRRSDLGRVIYPDHGERLQRWIREQADKTWLKVADEFRVTERTDWLANFEASMRKLHLDQQEAMEEDWWAAYTDPLTKRVFSTHYDEQDPNSPLKSFSSGLTYAREVNLGTTPAPFSRGSVLQSYLAQMSTDISMPGSTMLRALVCNQGELIVKAKAALDAQAQLDPLVTAGEHLHENRNDKLYDLGNALAQGARGKYSWATTLATLAGTYSLGVSHSLVSAAMVPVGKAMLAAGINPTEAAWVSRALGVQLVQQTMAMSMEALAQGHGVRTPVLITRDIRISTLLNQLAGNASADAQKLASDLQRLQQGQRTIRVSVLTDNKTLAQVNGDIKSLVQANPAGVSVGRTERAAQAQAAPSATVSWSLDEFKALRATQVGVTDRAAQAMREMTQVGRAAVTSLGGQLAIGTVLINATGFLNNLASIRNSQDAQAVRYAWFGLADAGAGTIGGAVELLSVGATAQAAARAAAGTSTTALTAQSGFLTRLRLMGALMGVAAGAANVGVNYAKGLAANNEGNPVVARLYFTSAIAFGGLGATSFGYGAGVLANRMVARGVTNGVVRVVSVRLGTAAAASALSGWGLVLLGVGLIAEVGAVLLTPTPIEKWARRTRFGKKTGERYKSWDEELLALDAAINEANPKATTTPATAAAAN